MSSHDARAARAARVYIYLLRDISMIYDILDLLDRMGSFSEALTKNMPVRFTYSFSLFHQ